MVIENDNILVVIMEYRLKLNPFFLVIVAGCYCLCTNEQPVLNRSLQFCSIDLLQIGKLLLTLFVYVSLLHSCAL